MPGARISQAHGTTSATPVETGAQNATTYAMYHPAAALRQHSLKETMLVDMCALPEVLIESRNRRQKDARPRTESGSAELVVVPVVPEPEPLMAPRVTLHAEPALPTVAITVGAEPPMGSAGTLDAVTVVATAASSEPQLELFG